MFMKHLITIALSFITVFIQAQVFSGDGYYRAYNKKTERYIYVLDNTGKVNWTALDAELGAIELWRDCDEHIRFTDPATVVYMEQHGSQYDFQCQGMGLYKMFKQYVTLQKGSGYYSFTVTRDGVTKSLSDSNSNPWPDEGKLGTNGSAEYRKWVISKVDVADEWFGINPSIEVDGKFYHPFYADFGFTPVSEDMRVWYISVVDTAGAVLKEFTGDVVPANMPVFIECTSSDPEQNKLDLKYNRESVPADNKLQGVYFKNLMRDGISDDAATEFDESTMRVLGVTQDGRLGYILSKVPKEPNKVNGKQYLAANQSYLVVGSDCPSEIPVITEAEYEEILANRGDAAVHIASYTTPKEVYSISGRFIGKLTTDEIKKLSPGIYIIGRRKVTVE